jgi:hypothetical protein
MSMRFKIDIYICFSSVVGTIAKVDMKESILKKYASKEIFVFLIVK